MPRVEIHQNWKGYPVAIGRFDISEEGVRVISGNSDNIYSIDDATERFMDEIDYWTGELAAIEESQKELMRQAVRDPLGMDYDEKFSELKWSWEVKHQIKTALEKDLSELLGHNVPWEESGCCANEY